MINFSRYFTLLVIILTIAGCAPAGRYYQHHDSAPNITPSKVTSQDAVAEYVSYAAANMRPYTIRGIRYKPLSLGKGFSDEGYASWYGQKFHGHLTANGEIYDMYEMTAAHKTLPLPSFVRVTNLKNGNQVVVRVNDRGPFYSGRVIDLSYAAALKLDMLKTGTAKVKVDVIHVDQTGKFTVGKNPSIITKETIKANQQVLIQVSGSQNKTRVGDQKINVIHREQLQNDTVERSPSINKKQTKRAYQQVFIQVAALQNKTQIDNLAKGLRSLYQRDYQTKYEAGIYKLHLGPMQSEHDADTLLNELKKNDYPDAYKVYSD